MKYYVTVPIYYVNAAPHIGHAYTTIAGDLLCRLKRMQGCESVLASGSDEHSQNVERAARAAGRTPEEHSRIIAAEFQEQWEILGLRVDRFIRTSNPRHHAKVQWMFERCRANGAIYKGNYTGQYCFHCNLYVNDAGPGDPCPDCKRPTETVQEENYFFRLSAYQDKLLELYDQHPEFIQPEIRRNEVISFVKQGLRDLSITRSNLEWGIPVPVEGRHVFYVWFDALITYLTAVEGEDLWPADLHLIGKEIVRFHAVYWPAFLMAAGLPLPRRIYAHGWLLFENEKMSKSRGNIVRALPIHEVMGADALRYFLLREIVFGKDGSFSYDALVTRYNADLANGLGNLASRTLSMIHQYREGLVPSAAAGVKDEIVIAARETIATTLAALESLEFTRALESVWGLISIADKFIVEQAPWTLIKKSDLDSQAKLDSALYTAAEVLRVTTVLLAPVLPGSAAKIWAQLGMTEALDDVRINDLAWGQLAPGQKAGEPSPVFPRRDLAASVEKMRELEQKELERQAGLLGKPPGPPPAPLAAEIAIDDFAKVDLRVGVVRSAEAVKGADKLLHLMVDIGESKPRSIVAGIATAYNPETLAGRKVVIVANLQPRKLRGIESQGMIVAASLEGGAPVLAGFLEEVPIGARLK